MTPKIGWIAVCAGLLALPLRAQESRNQRQNFEGEKPLAFQMATGKASEGSTVSLSDERAHGTGKALKVHYQFTGSGYLQFLTPTPIALNATAAVKMRMWVYGTGTHIFDGAVIRFVDAHNETFQYPLGKEIAEALNGEGWHQVEAALDLTKPTGHWGDNSDGVPDLPMKFLGFAFDHTSPEAVAGAVYLDDLELESTGTALPASASQPVQKDVLSLQPVWMQNTPAIFIYPPGTRVSVRAGVKPDSVQAGQKLVWTARDFDDNIVARGEIPIQGQQASLSLPAGKPGLWYVAAELQSAQGATIARDETRVAFASLATAPTPAQPLLWGINSHPERQTLPEVEREAALASGLGFTAVRGGAGNWLSVQPNNAQEWNWEKGDQILPIFERYNLKIIQGFLGTPKWASSFTGIPKEWQAWAYVAPKDWDTLATYLKEATRRYSKYAIAYEVWNEPDIAFWRGTPEEYDRLFEVSRAAIKSVNPQARVMNGGFSETKRQPDFIPNFAKNAAQKPDIFAYHTHQQFSNLVRTGDDVKNYLAAAKWQGTPVWLNEAGFSSSGKLTERDQASALIKKFSYSAALGYEAYFWYDLRNDGNEPTDLEHNFGLVRRDFTPKAAAVAARTLTAQLGGKRFVRRIPAPAGIYALLFEGKNATGQTESTAVVWNEASSGAQVPLFWKVPGSANRVTAMGDQQTVNTQGGIAITTAAPMPEFVTIKGAASSIGLVENVLKFDGAVLAAGGSSETWKLTLSNPLSKELRGQLKLSPQDGWKVNQSEIDFALPPNGKREFSLAVAAPTGALMSTMKFDIISPALPTRLTALVRLLPAVSIPRLATRGPVGDFSRWKEPTVRLGSTHLVSLFEATPMQELHFHGDSDLSAQVNMARVPEGLLLSVRAQDDTHVQKEAAGVEWQGDSLQFAISLPSGENYEWLAALGEQGPKLRLMNAPASVPTGLSNWPVTIRRQGSETLYEVLIPTQLPGNGVKLPDRFSFSLLVNDNDGAGRKGWVEWTPGIGRSKDPSQFQPLVVH